MGYNSILSNPAYGGTPAPASGNNQPTGYRSIIPAVNQPHVRAIANSMTAEQNHLAQQLPKVSAPKAAAPGYLNSISSVKEAQAALKTGNITHDQFLAKFSQLTNAPTKPGPITARDIVGSLGRAIPTTGRIIAQGIARTAPEAALTLQPTGSATVQHQNAGPAMTTKDLGPAPKVTPTKTTARVLNNNNVVTRSLFGKEPVQSIQAKSKGAETSHPGGFHIPGTPLTLNPKQTGAAEGALSAASDASLLPITKILAAAGIATKATRAAKATEEAAKASEVAPKAAETTPKPVKSSTTPVKTQPTVAKSTTPSLSIPATGSSTVGKALSDKALLDEHPHLNDITIKYGGKGIRTDETGKVFHTKSAYVPSTNTIVVAKGLSKEEELTNVRHELQHAIQAKEGRYTGQETSKLSREDYLNHPAETEAKAAAEGYGAKGVPGADSANVPADKQGRLSDAQAENLKFKIKDQQQNLASHQQDLKTLSPKDSHFRGEIKQDIAGTKAVLDTLNTKLDTHLKQRADEAKAPLLPKGPAKNEAGSVDLSGVKEHIQKTMKVTKASGDLQRDIYAQSNRVKEIKNDLGEAVKTGPKYTNQEKANVQQHLEATGAKIEARDLTPRELELKAQTIEYQRAGKKMRDKMAEMGDSRYGKSKEPGTFIHRLARNKGGAMDYILRGDRNNPLQIGGFSKSAPSVKRGVFHAVTDEAGNRKIVAIKNVSKKTDAGKIVARGKTVTEMTEGGKVKGDLGVIAKKPIKKVDEFYDENVRKAVQGTANKMGLRVEKTTSRRGNYVARSFTSKNRIELKAGAPTRTMLHEIGHQLDEKYDLEKQFVGNKATKQELRDLADLRHEDAAASANFKKYVRKGEEKVAVMFEAYLHAPERFKEIAPKTFKKFEAFLKSHPETKPLLDVKPSLVIGHDVVKSGEELLGHEFIGKDGKKYTIGSATTEEITKATGQKYYTDPLLASRLDFAETSVAYHNAKFMDQAKKMMEDAELAVKEGETAPKGFVPTSNSYFHGYRLDPRLAEILDDATFHKDKGAGIVLNPIGRALRQAIVYFPIKHDINMLWGYAQDRGLTGLSPTTWKRGASSILEAHHEISTLGPKYRAWLRSGSAVLGADDSKVAKIIQKELKTLQGDPEHSRIIAAAAGLNPVKAYNAIQHTLVWEVQDLLNLSRVIERTKPSMFGLKKGIDFQTAIKDMERFNLQYRVGSRAASKTKAGRVMSGVLNSDVVFFGRYRYDLFRITANIMKDAAKVKDINTASAAWNKLAITALATALIWPEVDKGIQKLTGVPNAYMKAPGTLGIPTDVYNVLKGKADPGTTASNQLYLNSAYTYALDIKDNRDPFTGKNIRDVNASGKDQFNQVVKWSTSQLAPVQGVKNLSNAEGAKSSRALNVLLALSSVRFPKNSFETNKLNSLKYDSLPNTQTEAKSKAASGDTEGAIKLIQNYDNAVVSAAKKALKAAGQPVPDDKTLIAHLKASQFYYNPTLKTIQGWSAPVAKKDTLQTIMNAKATPKKGDPDYRTYLNQQRIKARATRVDKATNPQNYQPVIK